VLIVDGDDRVVDLNPAAEQLFGVTVDTAVGESLRTVSESLVDVVAGVDSDQVELELGGDGEPVQYYDVRVSSLDHAYRTITGRVISLREVTDRQQREQRLDVLNRLLRHNLRNEMNLVRGNAELLRSHLDTTDPAVEERLSQIESTVDTVVERGDKVGQISRGLDSDETRPLDLATLAADAADTVRSGHDDVTVTVDVPEGLLVQGTRGLERVIVELLENAVEHSSTSRRTASDDAAEHGSVSDPAGVGEGVGRSGEAVTVAVTAAVVDGVVELSVSDDGTGIDRQERVVIEDGEETALQHGSGVGLWLVRWIVREHGGTVTFEDCEDGTTVVVRLPLAERRNRAGAAAGGAD
jgi:PAS domain S-box-containing protein